MTAAPKEQPSGKLWGGRFDRAPDELFYQFQRSFAFDRRLLPYELAVDRVWAGALESAGILSVEEMRDTLTALDKIAARAENEYAWLGGGLKNTVTGKFASIFGGKELAAAAEYEAIP